MKIEKVLAEKGFSLPSSLQIPAGVKLPFKWVRIERNIAYLSGHVPINHFGEIATPLGKVGNEVTVESAYNASRLIALAMLATLKNELGDLDKIKAWLRVFGMVNTAPGFTQTPAVINGFTDFILEVFGNDIGIHSRSAIGVASLPFNVPVEIEAEVLIDT